MHVMENEPSYFFFLLSYFLRSEFESRMFWNWNPSTALTKQKLNVNHRVPTTPPPLRATTAWQVNNHLKE
jgi:hypothetical protein